MRTLSEAADRLIPYWEMLVAITHHRSKNLTSSFMLSLVHLQYDFLVSWSPVMLFGFHIFSFRHFYLLWFWGWVHCNIYFSLEVGQDIR